MPAYDFIAIASGILISNPTKAPVSAGCRRNETFAAKKPSANRLKNACKRIPIDLSGLLPKTTIDASIKPNPMPHKIPSRTRFMPVLLHHHATSGKPDREPSALLTLFGFARLFWHECHRRSPCGKRNLLSNARIAPAEPASRTQTRRPDLYGYPPFDSHPGTERGRCSHHPQCWRHRYG